MNHLFYKIDQAETINHQEQNHSLKTRKRKHTLSDPHHSAPPLHNVYAYARRRCTDRLEHFPGRFSAARRKREGKRLPFTSQRAAAASSQRASARWREQKDNAIAQPPGGHGIRARMLQQQPFTCDDDDEWW